MKTLTQSPAQGLTFTHQDTEFAITTPDGRNFGHIGYDLTRHQWCYVPYGQSIKATGTLEACKTAARDDHEAQQQPLAKVITKGPKSRPSTFYSDCRYISRNQVQRITIGALDGSWTDEFWVDLRLASQLREGSVVVPHRPNGPMGELFLKWPKRPVRRQAIAA